MATKWERGNLEYVFSYFAEVCRLAAPAKISGICTNFAAIMSLRRETEKSLLRDTDVENLCLLISWGKESVYILWPWVSCPLWFPFYKVAADRAAGSMRRHQSSLRARGSGAAAQGASASRCFTTAGTEAPAHVQLSAFPAEKGIMWSKAKMC